MEIERVGLIGSGTMGSGIAQVAAQSGLNVILYDVNDDMLKRAVGQIDKYMKRAVEKGRMSSEQAWGTLGRITTTSDLGNLAPCEMIIEAAPEILELKQSIFRDLGGMLGRIPIVAQTAILATNTSTLSVTEIGAAVENPSRVVGMHFFNPPPLMPLVEVIGGTETSEETVVATVELARRMGKTPVRAKDVPGFIVNRVARPFYLEGLRLLAEGVADPATIDRLIKGGGKFRMGPFELMDLIGLDINYAASQSIYNAYFQEPRFRPSVLQQRMVESGRLGRKTGRGWYEYGE